MKSVLDSQKAHEAQRPVSSETRSSIAKLGDTLRDIVDTAGDAGEVGMDVLMSSIRNGGKMLRSGYRALLGKPRI